MNDFFAANPAWTGEGIRRLASASGWANAPSIIALLAASATAEGAKLEGRALYERLLLTEPYRAHLRESWALIEALGLLPPMQAALDEFCGFAWYLRVDFKLETPYISKDDRAFSVTDNPVRKDRVFEAPLVAGTTWKGALRNVCRVRDGKKVQLDRLFGKAPEESGKAEDARKGTLHFYPTFFRGAGLETINPHDRKTRTGKNPIRIECVPRGSAGRFALLYAPVVSTTQDEMAADTRLVMGACAAMLQDFGFGAKKSSGYGSAADKLDSGALFAKGFADWSSELKNLSDLAGRGEALAQRLEAAR